MKNKRFASRLILLLAATYMVSYVTRINFGAIISEMADATGFGKSALSMSLTGSFICYGAGQLLSGVLGDQISPKRLVSLGLGLSVLMNLLILMCQNPNQMLAVWCVNGLAQAFLWPPMVRMMSALLSQEDYRSAVTKVNWGGSFGTIFVYLAGPAIIVTAGWKGMFHFAAAAGAVMLVIWNLAAQDVRPEPKTTTRHVRAGGAEKALPMVLLPVMAVIVLHGMLRDGVTTWMPSFIAESYHLDNEISILTGVVLPVFSILSLQIMQKLYGRAFQNPLVGAAVLFGLGSLCGLGLHLLCGESAGVSVLLSATLTGCMHGINLLLVCMVPAFFAKYGNISTVSGVLNACTYIGSAISTYGVAALSEGMGWKTTILIWGIIALAGFLICLGSIRPWKKRMMEDKYERSSL